MGIFDRAREPDDNRDNTRREESVRGDEAGKPSGQVSQAGSSFDNAQSATGGADAVPDTPDVVEQDYT